MDQGKRGWCQPPFAPVRERGTTSTIARQSIDQNFASLFGVLNPWIVSITELGRLPNVVFREVIKSPRLTTEAC